MRIVNFIIVVFKTDSVFFVRCFRANEIYSGAKKCKAKRMQYKIIFKKIYVFEIFLKKKLLKIVIYILIVQQSSV